MSADSNPRLNLALLGHGKMGQAVEQLAPARGFEVRLILDEESNRDSAGLVPGNFDGIDVCLEFTTPGVVLDNIRSVAALGCNLVVGTTGWTGQIDDVRDIVTRAGIGMVYAPNFSIGAQLFFQAAEAAARLFGRFPMYEPYITETHHRFKNDAPSGTALELKRRIQPALEGREVAMGSVRAGYVPGTHELGFDSEADTVIVRHTARGRQGFAEGALYAARWVVGKKGLYAFADLFASGGGKERS
ncbi:MAG TPA: dihydrodipicolinate reductase C-terminal domain-containing protein [Terriglobia bacterium]|nr:dihydrodipicolinate reductase C-terminal domain-containing protein [Terriglobia bacterium]